VLQLPLPVNVTVLRYFTVYSPAGWPDMSPFRFVQWISEVRPVIVYGDRQRSRDFTYCGRHSQACPSCNSRRMLRVRSGARPSQPKPSQIRNHFVFRLSGGVNRCHAAGRRAGMAEGVHRAPAVPSR